MITSNLLQRNRSEGQNWDRFTRYRLNAMASQMIELARANSNNEVEELIDFNVSQGSLDCKVNSTYNTRIYRVKSKKSRTAK